MQMIGDALAEVVSELELVGIRATTEPSEMHIPCALVAPGTLYFDVLDADTYSADIDIILLTDGSNHSTTAMNDLQVMLNQIRLKFQLIEAEPIWFTPANSGDPVPGLRTTLRATITKD